jgi:hypothetical protein
MEISRFPCKRLLRMPGGVGIGFDLDRRVADPKTLLQLFAQIDQERIARIGGRILNGGPLLSL